MKNKLTPKEIRLMETVKNEWIEKLYNCELRTDRKKATKAINWLYKLSGFEKPLIIFLFSPFGAQYGANIMRNKGNQINKQIENQVEKQVESQVLYQVNNQVEKQVFNQVFNQVWNHVRIQTEKKIESQVQSQILNQKVGNKVWNQVGSHVGNHVGSHVKNQKLKSFSFCSYGSIIDYGWVSFYEYFKKIGIKIKPEILEKFNNFVFLLNSGIYDMIQFEKICIVSDMPTFISIDDRGRLHNAKGSAIKFADGYEINFMRGVAL